MKLISIELCNFRAFLGTHRIEFSTSETAPITVFIGENGGGKTTFLNAIFWLFTGKFKKDFPSQETLIHRDLSSDRNADCYVEALILDRDQTLRVRRSVIKGSKSELDVWRINSETGNQTPLMPETARNHLESLLPPKLANWFIFDGEYVKSLDLKGSPDLKDEIYRTFGLEFMRTLTEDLRKIEDNYSREEGRLIGDEKLASLQAEIDHDETLIEKWSDLLARAKYNHASSERLAKSKEEELKKYGSSQAAAERRQKAKRRKQEQESLRDLKVIDKKSLIAESASAVILKPFADRLDEILDGMQKNQKIPSDHSETLVKTILRGEKCICGRPVKHPSVEYETIQQLLDTASTSALDSRLHALRSEISSLSQVAKRYPSDLEKIVREINSYTEKISEEQHVIDQAQMEIDSIPEDVVSRLESERYAAEQEAKRYFASIVNIERDIEATRSTIQRKKLEYAKLLEQSGRNSVLKKLRQKAAKFRSFVAGEFSRQESDVLSALSSELSATIDRYLSKSYSVSVDPKNYQVITRDIDGREIEELSTGEYQTLKFAFISSIVGMASSRTKVSSVDWITEPVVAPLILDAPFSVLDPTYKISAAKNISEQSQQTAMMFDSGKWTGLDAALGNRIGRFYVFVQRIKGPQKHADLEKAFFIHNKSIPLVEFNSEADMSCVREIQANA